MSLRPRRHAPLLAVAIAVAAALAGCGSNDLTNVPRSIVISVPPMPIGTLVAGCTAAELEAWYEVATSLTNRFAVESLAALERPPETVPETLGRQIDLINRIIAEPVPECATDAQATIVQRLRAIHAAYIAFDDGQIDAATLRTRVREEHTAITTDVAAVLDDLGAGLEELFRLEAQTPAASR